MNYEASLDRDANRQVIPAGLPFLQRKNRTYTGAAGLGAIGTTTIFTVTGTVMVRTVGACTVDLVGAGSLQLGIPGNLGSLIAQIVDATNLDAGESWLDATPATLEGVDFSNGIIISAGQDIIETISAANITAGVLDLYCFWRPLSVDGAVVAA